jgi:hypothetical protein
MSIGGALMRTSHGEGVRDLLIALWKIASKRTKKK